MRISDWSSDVCSSDLLRCLPGCVSLEPVLCSAFGTGLCPPSSVVGYEKSRMGRTDGRNIPGGISEIGGEAHQIFGVKTKRPVSAATSINLIISCNYNLYRDRKSTRLNSSH